jgi:hypothetical protein
MGRPSRPKPPVDVVVEDEAAREHRFRALSRWFLPSQQGVQVEHRGTVRERLERLEELIDQRGLRREAQRHLDHLAAGRRRWPGGDPYSGSAA